MLRLPWKCFRNVRDCVVIDILFLWLCVNYGCHRCHYLSTLTNTSSGTYSSSWCSCLPVFLDLSWNMLAFSVPSPLLLFSVNAIPVFLRCREISLGACLVWRDSCVPPSFKLRFVILLRKRDSCVPPLLKLWLLLSRLTSAYASFLSVVFWIRLSWWSRVLASSRCVSWLKLLVLVAVCVAVICHSSSSGCWSLMLLGFAMVNGVQCVYLDILWRSFGCSRLLSACELPL